MVQDEDSIWERGKTNWGAHYYLRYSVYFIRGSSDLWGLHFLQHGHITSASNRPRYRSAI